MRAVFDYLFILRSICNTLDIVLVLLSNSVAPTRCSLIYPKRQGVKVKRQITGKNKL